MAKVDLSKEDREEGVMPRETVFDDVELYDIKVGWEREKYVQVGIETHDRRAIVDKLLGADAQNPEVRAVIDGLLGDGQLASFTGLWGTLNRDSCNQLIRLLRRARDQAFGRDE